MIPEGKHNNVIPLNPDHGRDQAIAQVADAILAFEQNRYHPKPDHQLGGWMVCRGHVQIARCMSHEGARDYAGYLNARIAEGGAA